MISLELFSGAGGLAKGLELAGFRHAAFVEFNRDACASLRENFEPEKVFFGDIREYNLDSLNHIDVVAGGPPCQPFSLGGKHRADLDNRDMFPYAIKAIEKLMPKAFIFENVKGLLRPSFSEYFEYIILRLTYPGIVADPDLDWRRHILKLRNIRKHEYGDTKYDVYYQLINASDYGVPQNRERVVIVGLRADLGVSWSFPERTHSEDKLLWDMYVTGEYWMHHNLKNSCGHRPDEATLRKTKNVKNRYALFEPDLMPWVTIRDALSDIPNPRENHGIPDHIYRGGARSYSGHTGSDIDWPSKTIKAGGHGVPGGENIIRFDDGSVRYLTVLEAKIIQTFPINYAIKGSWGEAMRQIGNAVPVRLAEIIGNRLASILVSGKTSYQTAIG